MAGEELCLDMRHKRINAPFYPDLPRAAQRTHRPAPDLPRRAQRRGRPAERRGFKGLVRGPVLPVRSQNGESSAGENHGGPGHDARRRR